MRRHVTIISTRQRSTANIAMSCFLSPQFCCFWLVLLGLARSAMAAIRGGRFSLYPTELPFLG
jgi:hypothetical protein